MTVKLTRPQMKLLQDLEASRRGGEYVAPHYPPIRKLLGLGFVAPRVRNGVPDRMGDWYAITEEGKAFLQEQKHGG